VTGEVVEWVNAREWQRRLADMEARYLTPEQEYVAVIEMLEMNEYDVFARLHGRYDNTGATRRSLTESSGEAIRRIEGPALDFGTSVWYAHFLTRRIGPGTGRRGGLKRTGGSAVLRISRTRAKEIGHRLMIFLANGHREDVAALNQVVDE
jgi:hypothetical protein